ncbi:hypothetical protein M231_06663 [Tremella mesenterica]|uniref:SAGA-associated factor 11 n=1 Tax=Tremella mesenterica TaxID=5217 RepID=A0A4Q1BBE1_TREME|nr:hypothetical protein M231_06663 [Tremella mesenterica]
MPDLDEELKVMANSIFDEMLDNVLLTTTISAHREIVRGRLPCNICHTHCRGHQPLVQETPSQAGGYLVGPEKGTGGATGIGSGSGKMDNSGNVFFECLVCRRLITSNRYAPHLSSCLGLKGSTRRGARAAANKIRLGTTERSSSPYYQPSEAGSEESVASKKKKMNGSSTPNGMKRNKSPSKVGQIGKRLHPGSGSATPTGFPRAAPGPSRLGQPPHQPDPDFSSPISSVSPEKSVTSFPDSSTSSQILGSIQAPAVVEDSDEDMDDY